MKARVIMPFNGKKEKKQFNTGDIFEVSPERFAEINKTGRFVVEVKQEEKPAEKADKE